MGQQQGRAVSLSAATLEASTKLFKFLAHDGDEKISSEAWMAAFDKLDADSNGFVSRKEWSCQGGENLMFDFLKGRQAGVGLHLSRAEWEGRFQSLDHDKDGHVCLAEFASGLDAYAQASETPEAPEDGMTGWSALLQMLKLDALPEVTQEDWDKSFDAIQKRSGVGIAREDWEAINGSLQIFENISGSGEQAAVITKEDWHLAFANASQLQLEAQKLFRTLHVERFLADAIPKDVLLTKQIDDPVDALLKLQEKHVQQLVQAAAHDLADQIMTAIERWRKLCDAKKAVQIGANGKFTGMMEGGGIDDFYAGVTGIVGEPHMNLKEGVYKEHCVLADSGVAFTTSNYGITTMPKTEHSLIAEYKKTGGDAIHVADTRRCSAQDGTSQEDKRTIRPISYFEDLQVSKQVSLQWVEVLAIVLYTGPMHELYNGILRGVGYCGEVAEGVPFWTKQFEEEHKACTVKDRMKTAGHWYSSTIHCLTSAVKKLQRVRSGVQGTWLYRGLGGLDISGFVASNGFAERAFTSTTEKLEVALNYSGAKKGKAGTILAMKMSEVDQGAKLHEFSQYPGEEEIVWNACSYLEALKGKETQLREELKITEWGPVRVVKVKMTARCGALTVEELESQRKSMVVNMLETIEGDIARKLANHEGLQSKLRSQCTKARLDPTAKKKAFIDIATTGSHEMVKKYKERQPAWFHSNEQLALAISDAAFLTQAADSWVQSYLEDKAKHIVNAADWKFWEAQKNLRLLLQRQLDAARLAQDVLETKRLAAVLCSMRGYVKGPDSIDAAMIEGGEETPLIEKCVEGDALAVKLLVEAGAAIERHNTEGRTPLHIASWWGNLGAARVLLDARADVTASDKYKRMLLHFAAQGGSVEILQILLEKGVNLQAKDGKEKTALHWAALQGKSEALRALLDAGADVRARDSQQSTPLHSAAFGGDSAAVEALLKVDADIQATDKSQYTALHWAAFKGMSGAAQILLAARADIEAKDCDQRTPLHHAAKDGKEDAVKLLLEAKADIEAKDKDGMTATVHAQRVGLEIRSSWLGRSVRRLPGRQADG